MTPTASPLDACPDLDALAALVDGAVSEARRARLEAHLVGCEACRTTVAASARAVEAVAGGDEAARADRSDAAGATPPVRARWPFPALAAAAVLCALGAFFALRTEEPPDPLHAAFAALREARPDLFAADRPLSEAELAASGIAVQRGGIAWMAPGGTTTEERPTFQWAEVDGADGYRVTITDAGGARIFSTTTRSARLEGTSLSKPLAAGADYVWKVTALDAPTPAEGATALHVATATERALVRAIVEAVEARGRGAVADLVTAQALLRRGFAAEALPFVRRYVERAPGDATGQATLALALRRLAPAESGR